jgi:hypothetical protein
MLTGELNLNQKEGMIMKKNYLLVWIAIITGMISLGFAVSASAQVYEIANGVNSQPVFPLSKAESAVDYYTYNTPFASSGDPDFGTVSSVGFIWLYEDTLTEKLSLGTIFDKPNDGSGGMVEMTFTGVPPSGSVDLKDDPGNVLTVTGGDWVWHPCCTDGGVIGGLEGEFWEIVLTLDSATGVDQWFFLNGPSAVNPISIPLDMSDDLVVSAIPGPRIVKWRQPPDMEFGVNIRSMESTPRVADDWRCTDPRPVTDVHFWGSFINWERENPQPTEPPPKVDAFWIRIYDDIPANTNPDIPYSRPGTLLYEVPVSEFEQTFKASIRLPDQTYEHKFYYSLDLREPFTQQVGTIYWISISAVMGTGEPQPPFSWGWETSTRHWNDNAARLPAAAKWQEITPDQLPDWYDREYDTVDMAFELTVPYEPPRPPEMVKWQQRPDMKRGINVLSNPRIDPPDILTVSDDWLCLGGSPVADLHFWGSYLNWGVNRPKPPEEPPGVEAFRIRIFSDRPATAEQFSRPDLLLYEEWVDASNFNETFIGTIPLVQGQLYEHKFRYDLDLPRIFWQKRDRIYWLNIAAVPRDPEFQWGWESSMDRWNDYAVQGFYMNPDENDWNPIFSRWTEDFVDMSFELTTCSGPIKWLQFPDMADGINVPALLPERILADDWLCREGKPITEVHLWGSYLDPSGRIHWEETNPGPPSSRLPLPPGVEAFRLSFHRDVPAGVDPDMPWSHPGELLQEALIERNQFSERYWDSVPHINEEGVIWWEHKFYYILKLEKPFEQEAGNIYWLDVAARPVSGSDFVWGWETSKDHWNDSAVRGNGRIWRNLGHLGTDFDDIPLGATYNLGNTFITSGIPIRLERFQWSNGTWTDTGFTRVVAQGRAGGAWKELAVNNVNLAFGIDVPVTGLSLLFGEYGGNLNIRINGDFRNFINFTDIDGLNIGNVHASVVNSLGADTGILRLIGQIHDFAVGGQELFIDGLQTGPVDMAFLLYAKDETDVCEADFDRDGNVDNDDLEDFAEDFGRDDCYFTGDCEGDFKYDGDVDGEDVKTIMDDYGRDDCPCRLPRADAP